MHRLFSIAGLACLVSIGTQSLASARAVNHNIDCYAQFRAFYDGKDPSAISDRFNNYWDVSEHTVRIAGGREGKYGGRRIEIERLKAAGLEPVSLSFYQTATSANTSVAVYTTRFAQEGAIPMAPEGLHLIHDLSLHTPSILIPDEVLQRMRDTEDIDYFTGFYGEDVLKLVNNPDSRAAQGFAQSSLGRRSSDSPLERLRYNFRFGFRTMLDASKGLDTIDNQAQRMAPHEAVLKPGDLLADIDEFAKSPAGGVVRGFDPTKPILSDEEYEKMCLKAMRQRIAIRDIVQQLQRAPAMPALVR